MVLCLLRFLPLRFSSIKLDGHSLAIILEIFSNVSAAKGPGVDSLYNLIPLIDNQAKLVLD